MGRTSLAPERRAEILDAYERLIPMHGLSVSFKEIAATAGMSPSIISHYFGGRTELERAVTERAVERHRLAFMRSVEGLEGGDRVQGLVQFMFGGEWTALCRRDFHIPALFAQARMQKPTREILRAGFATFESVLTELLGSAFPDAPPEAVEQTAYALMCLGRSHEDFIAIGFPASRNDAALRAATSLVETLEETGVPGHPRKQSTRSRPLSVPKR